MEYTTHVVVSVTYPALHAWPGAPKSGPNAHLAHPHRHDFAVTVHAPVTHGDREIEFFDLQREVAATLDNMVTFEDSFPSFGSRSCEQIAAEVLARLPMLTACAVFEDKNVGAYVESAA